MDALIWAMSFVFGLGLLGGSAFGCVFIVERNKTKRKEIDDSSKRMKMDLDWNMEQKKLEIMQEAQQFNHQRMLGAGGDTESTVPKGSNSISQSVTGPIFDRDGNLNR